MPNNYFTEKRKIDKQNLLNFINQHKDVPMKKVIGIFSMNTGLTVKRIELYVDELIQADLIDKETD